MRVCIVTVLITKSKHAFKQVIPPVLDNYIIDHFKECSKTNQQNTFFLFIEIFPRCFYEYI